MHPLHLELFFFVIYDHLSHWHRCIVPSIYSINIFYSSQVTWRHVPINPYPHNGGSALHLFGSQQSQLRSNEKLHWQLNKLKVLFGSGHFRFRELGPAFTSRDYPLNPECARRVTEPCLTSVSRSPRQGERTFDIFCLATTFCHQKNIFWPPIRKCTMGLDGFQVASISAWSHSAEVLELCLVWLKAAPHLRPWMETVHKSCVCATTTFTRAHPAKGKKGTRLQTRLRRWLFCTRVVERARESKDFLWNLFH